MKNIFLDNNPSKKKKLFKTKDDYYKYQRQVEYLGDNLTRLPTTDGPKKHNGFFCIDGVCGLKEQAGLKMPHYTSNSLFEKDIDINDHFQVKSPKGDYNIGDHIIVHNTSPNDIGPHHSMIITKIKEDDGKKNYLIVDNAGSETAIRKRWFTADELANKTKDISVHANGKNITTSEWFVYRPGSEVFKADRKLGDMSPEAIAAFNEKKNRLQGESIRNYFIHPSVIGDINKSDYNTTKTSALKYVAGLVNDDNFINNTALYGPKYTTKSDVQKALMNTLGIIEQESKFNNNKQEIKNFRNKLELGVENAFPGVMARVFGASIGPGQVKWSQLSDDVKKKAGIDRPADLLDPYRTVDALTQIQLHNTDYIKKNKERLNKSGVFGGTITDDNASDYALYLQNQFNSANKKSLLDLVYSKYYDKHVGWYEHPWAMSKSELEKSRDYQKYVDMYKLNFDEGSYPSQVINYKNKYFDYSRVENNPLIDEQQKQDYDNLNRSIGLQFKNGGLINQANGGYSGRKKSVYRTGGVFKDPPVNPIPSGVNVFATSNSIYKTPNNTTVNKPVEYNPVYKNLAEKNFTQQELAAINNKKPDVLKQDRSIPKPTQLTPFEQKVLEKEMEAQTFGQQRVTYNQFGEPVLKFDPSMPKATGRIEPDYMDPITMAATFGAGAYGKGLSLADAALVGLDAGTYGASSLGKSIGKSGFNALKNSIELSRLKGYKEILENKTLPGPVNVTAVVNTAKNLEDLNAAQKFAQQYGYELPQNLERIAQSNVLTDRTIRGLMDRHNTFVRGVSTNWDEIAKKNPEILRHLEGKGFDLSTKEGTKAAAEYMATHIPISTGYGRASLNWDVFSQGLEGLYTSNSIPTAEGYTYGQGFITKVKKPTNYSSFNRQDWITQNNPQYYEHKLPNGNTLMVDGKITKAVDMKLPNIYFVKDFDNINVFKNTVIKDLEKQAANIKETLEKTAISNPYLFQRNNYIYNNIVKQIEDIKAQKWEFSNVKFDKNLLKTEHQVESFGTDFGSFGNTAEDVANKLSLFKEDQIKHSQNLIKLTKQVGAKYNKKIFDLTEEYTNLLSKGENTLTLPEKTKLQSLEDEISNLKWNSKNEVTKLHTEYLDNNFPNWQNQKDKYAHYIHLGTPGEKILQPIKSWEITPEIWKNKSRAHTNIYTKKLSAMESGGIIDEYNKGGLIKRADGGYSRKGLWDNIRANRGSGKEPTKQMLEQEKKIKAKYQNGSLFKDPPLSPILSIPPITPATSPDVQIKNAQKFTQGWLDSSMHKKMLDKSVKVSVRRNPDITENLTTNSIIQGRQNNLNITDVNQVTEDFYPTGSGIGGSSEKIQNGRRPVNVVIDMPPEYMNIADTTVHELSHATDNSGQLIPVSDQAKIYKYFRKGVKNHGLIKNHRNQNPHFSYYVAKDTETRARLNSIRYQGKEQGIYDPYTEKINRHQLNKIKDNTQYSPLKQLKDVYKTRHIINMMNSISQTTPQTTSPVQYAANGGLLNNYNMYNMKYQNGGPFKDLNKTRISSSLFGNKYYNQDSPNFGVNASLFKYKDIGDRYNTLNYGPEVFLNADPINRRGNIGLGVNLEGFNSQGVNADLKAGLMSRYDNNKIKFNPYAYGEIGPYYKKRVGKGINRGEQTINPYVFLGTDFYKGPIENSTAGVGLNYNRTFNKKKNTPSIYGDAQFSLDREGGNFSSSPSRYTGYVSAKLGVSGLFSSKYKKPINKKTDTPTDRTYMRRNKEYNYDIKKDYYKR